MKPQHGRSIWTSQPESLPQRRVVITGMGIVSPLGVGLQHNTARLWRGESGIDTIHCGDLLKDCVDDLSFLPADSQYRGLVGGRVPFGEEPGSLNISRYMTEESRSKMGRKDMFSYVAGIEALEDANWAPTSTEQSERSGIIISSALNNSAEVEEMTAILRRNKADIAALPKYSLAVAAVPAIHLGLEKNLNGPSFGQGAACAGGGYGIATGALLIHSGLADVMVVGGADSAVSLTCISSFVRIGAYVPHNDERFIPQKRLRPFDRQRNGTACGEGAAVLVLEEYEHAVNRKARIYAEVIGSALHRDGRSITAPNGEGETLTCSRALKQAGLRPNEIDLVIPHATGTVVGDPIEALALNRLFGSYSPLLTATKGATGHQIAAATAFDTIIAAYSLFHQSVPPIVNLEDPIPESNLFSLVRSAQDAEIDTALVHGLGLGGEDCAIVLKRMSSPTEHNKAFHPWMFR